MVPTHARLRPGRCAAARPGFTVYEAIFVVVIMVVLSILLWRRTHDVKASTHVTAMKADVQKAVLRLETTYDRIGGYPDSLSQVYDLRFSPGTYPLLYARDGGRWSLVLAHEEVPVICGGGAGPGTSTDRVQCEVDRDLGISLAPTHPFMGQRVVFDAAPAIKQLQAELAANDVPGEVVFVGWLFSDGVKAAGPRAGYTEVERTFRRRHFRYTVTLTLVTADGRPFRATREFKTRRAAPSVEDLLTPGDSALLAEPLPDSTIAALPATREVRTSLE